MKIFFLGTNGWYDTGTGNTVCVLIETKKEYIILDAGNGLYKVDRYIKNKKPIYLFLSHFHLDHLIGLHILDKFSFSQGIDVFGPPGLKRVIPSFLKEPLTIPMGRLKTRLRLHNLNEAEAGGLKFEAKKLFHSTTCFGYRFYLENKIITYCTDTGFCENLFLLARNTDLLIAECSFRPGERNKKWPHLNPEQAGLAAKRSKAKKMALVHFDASRYLDKRSRLNAQRLSRKIFKNTIAAGDDMRITL